MAEVNHLSICVRRHTSFEVIFKSHKIDGGGGGMLRGHEQEAYGTCNCKWWSQDFPVGPQPKEKRVMTYYYRPQLSCSKVIFSQASVSHSVHRGV